MPDDQNKTSTIDDLVKELSRPQGEARSVEAAKSNNSDQSRSQSNRESSAAAASGTPPLSASASQGPPTNLPGIKLPAPAPDVDKDVKPQGPVFPPRSQQPSQTRPGPMPPQPQPQPQHQPLS